MIPAYMTREEDKEGQICAKQQEVRKCDEKGGKNDQD